jgi:hypothetical protein
MRRTALALLLLAAPAAHNRVYECDPQYSSPEEFFCLRNPASCDPTAFWACKSLRCARYLLELDRKKRCPRGPAITG